MRPLQEGAQLKKRFDAIFESTRYTKALKAISEEKKKQKEVLKDHQVRGGQMLETSPPAPDSKRSATLNSAAVRLGCEKRGVARPSSADHTDSRAPKSPRRRPRAHL